MQDANEHKSIKVKPAPKQARDVVIREDVHTHQRFANGETESWNRNCRACVKSDHERKPVAQDELANTLFVYSGRAHDSSLAVEFLEKRYAGLEIEHGSAFPIWQLVSNPELQIVCVRPVPPVGKMPQPAVVWQKNAWGDKVLDENPDREGMLAEFAESEPLKVSELCSQAIGASGKLMTSGHWNADALIRRIFECFSHCATVKVPAPDKSNELLTVSSL